MSTKFSFTRKLALPDVIAPAKSVGSHLGAKLECFGTDERTLTDELCDMLCIWLGTEHSGRWNASATSASFELTVSKTTTAEEVLNGADLELIVSTPLGSKRCLIQAKVLEPTTGKLRCDSTTGWRKLRSQLVAARKEVGELAFLLVYVPGGFLDGDSYGYGTYEQGVMAPPGGSTEASRGATLIPVNALLGTSGRWRYTADKVRQATPGVFVAGLPLWQVLLELMLCRRGKWAREAVRRSDLPIRVFRTLSVSAGEISPEGWLQLQASADQYLPTDNVRGRERN